MPSAASAASPAPNRAASASVSIDPTALEADALLPITPRRQKIGINGSGILPSPGSLESMLKTTMETGDIGLFTIAPRHYRPPTRKHDRREMSLIDAVGEANHPLLTMDGTCDIPHRPKSSASGMLRANSHASSRAPRCQNHNMAYDRGYSLPPGQFRMQATRTPAPPGAPSSLPHDRASSGHPSEFSTRYGTPYESSVPIQSTDDDRYQPPIAPDARMRSTSSPFQSYSPLPNQRPPMHRGPNRRHISAPPMQFMPPMPHPQYPYTYPNTPIDMDVHYRRLNRDGSCYGGCPTQVYPQHYSPAPGYFPNAHHPMRPQNRSSASYGPPPRRRDPSHNPMRPTRKSTVIYSQPDDDSTCEIAQSGIPHNLAQTDKDEFITVQSSRRPPPSQMRNGGRARHSEAMTDSSSISQLPIYEYHDTNPRQLPYTHSANSHRQHASKHSQSHRSSQYKSSSRRYSGQPQPYLLDPQNMRSIDKRCHSKSHISTISADEVTLSSIESASPINNGDDSLLKATLDPDNATNTTASSMFPSDDELKTDSVPGISRSSSTGRDRRLSLRNKESTPSQPLGRLKSKSSFSLRASLSHRSRVNAHPDLVDSTQKIPQVSHDEVKPKIWNRIASKIWRSRSSGPAPATVVSSGSSF
ncbi:hypothetical protein BROUX41_004812 [Berkeleyomyces rouxiae]